MTDYIKAVNAMCGSHQLKGNEDRSTISYLQSLRYQSHRQGKISLTTLGELANELNSQLSRRIWACSRM